MNISCCWAFINKLWINERGNKHASCCVHIYSHDLFHFCFLPPGILTSCWVLWAIFSSVSFYSNNTSTSFSSTLFNSSFLLPTAQCNHLPYIYFCFLCLQWQFMLKNRTLPFPTFCPPHPTWTTLNNSSCHYKWGDQSTSDSQCHIQTQRTGHLHLERSHRERIDIGR